MLLLVTTGSSSPGLFLDKLKSMSYQELLGIRRCRIFGPACCYWRGCGGVHPQGRPSSVWRFAQPPLTAAFGELLRAWVTFPIRAAAVKGLLRKDTSGASN